jgi:hypothetical protein
MQKILLKTLRYLLIMIIIYLVLKYTPYVQLDTKRAIAITIILTIFLAVIEFVYVKFLSSETNSPMATEGFDASGKDCGVCKNPQPKCRIVCTDVEGFTATPEDMHTEPITHSKSGIMPNTPVNPMPETRQSIVENQTTTKTPIPENRQGSQLVAEEYKKPVNQNNLGFGGMFYDNYVGSQNTGEYLSDPNYSYKEQVNQRDAQNRIDKNMEEQAYSTKGYSTPYQEPGAKSQTRKPIEQGRRIEGDVDNDLIYGDYNNLIVGAGYLSRADEYGYSFLPPEKWYVAPVRAPICVTDRPSTVYPNLANGTPVNLKEFQSASKFTQPAQINVAYIEERLNAGR